MAAARPVGHHGEVASGSRGVPLYTDDDNSEPGSQAGTPAPARRRRGGTWRDMVYSLAILMVPVLIGLAVWHYLTSDKQVNTVDPAPAITRAQQAHHFPVAVPAHLSDGWRVTSAATSGKSGSLTLRIGYVTPSGGFAQLVESDQDSAVLLADAVSHGGSPNGAVRIDGKDWSRYSGDGSRTVLGLLEPHRTILVVGQAKDQELRDLAGSL